MDFREQIPRRIRRTDLPLADWLKLIGGGVLLCGLCYDVARVFSVLQDGETGEFTLTVLMESDLSFFLPLIIVSAVALLVFASCIGIAALLSKKKN